MDGNTRRLPPWMVAGGSSGVTTTSNRTDDKSIDVKTIHESDGAPVTKGEKRPRRTVKPKERDDSDGPKKVGIKRKGGERARRIKTDEEEPKPSIGGDVKNPEIIQSVTGPKDEDLTVDDLLSFAQEVFDLVPQVFADIDFVKFAYGLSFFLYIFFTLLTIYSHSMSKVKKIRQVRSGKALQ